MTPYLQDADVTLYHGDAFDVLRKLPAHSIDCVVTSPPYWGLRDYGTGAWEGGDEGCDHQAAAPSQEGDDGKRRADEYLQDRGGNRHNRGEGGPVQHGGWEGRATRSDGSRVCKCGATRTDQQLGLESTPEEYVARMVEVFREVRRVLASHGTVWCNLGDTYNSRSDGSHGGWNGSGIKPKDLVGIPWRVAFALQADGWYLRSDIIWAKSNPMPESVTDRPTKAHEYVFLLSKQPRYFFDQEAVREAEGSGRNIRTVWEIATQPYSEAHFATFPEELARRCIAAGCPESVCRVCGKPWERETASERTDSRPGISVKLRQIGRGNAARTGRAGDYNRETLGLQPSCECGKIREAAAGGCITTSTLGEASGEGNDPGTSAAAGIILDPFVGSGTTCFVARKLGRRSIGIDLSADYLALAARRLQQQSLYALDTGAETPLGSERTE